MFCPGIFMSHHVLTHKLKYDGFLNSIPLLNRQGSSMPPYCLLTSAEVKGVGTSAPEVIYTPHPLPPKKKV